LARDLVLPSLGECERDRYWSEARLFAALFGIPKDSLAPDWTSFVSYTNEMVASDTLTVSATARDIAHQIFSGRVTGLRPPFWYRALTAQMLPEQVRVAFGLPLGEAEQRSARRALTWIRRIYPLLPDRLRTVGPYQEALARVRGERRPTLGTQWLNRLWIGQPSMGITSHDAAMQGISEQQEGL
jgi:uncharacterized protein (DUF2236 family)